MSLQFWLNLQTRYDFEVTEDQLENRLDNEVNALQAKNACLVITLLFQPIQNPWVVEPG